MDTDRWNRIEALFEKAMDLSPADRDVFLADACGDDAALLEEVRSLLRSYTSAQPFFARLSEQIEPIVTSELDARELTPSRIGPYRIDGEIGRGGMGTVYYAERDDGQYHQYVAIKVLRRGTGSSDIVRRFLAERQILASLNHGHIARLLDGGMTASGQPYFVLEYVKGLPLLDYCMSREVGLEERLRLFRDVCGAVQYAHQNLVIHRDLKPGNILVTDEGEVKLLDFGIAKLIRSDQEEALALTRDNVRPMTPLYASPEQLQGERITTTSDVYQLGMLLYELLTATRPFAEHESGQFEMERAIREEEPPPPSQAVRAMPAHERPPWSRRLEGDLDAIVLQAIRKEPALRYDSAAGLADDVENYVEGRPVLARRGSVTYRIGKFVRKYRMVASAAGVIAALLVTIAVLSVRFALVTSRQAEQVALERDKAAEMASFLVELFEVADPNIKAGTNVTAQELLRRGAVRIETELRNQPETRAMLMNTIGRIYRQLGLYTQSDALLSLALDERVGALGERHADVAETRHELGRLRWEQGQYAAAESLMTAALAQQKALYGDQHVAVAQALSDLAWVLHNKGVYARAEALFAEALGIRRTLLGNRHEDVAESLSNLAAVLRNRGAYEDAERYYREALEMYREVLGPEHVRVAQAVNDLAAVLQDRGRYDEAEPYAHMALALYRKLYGSEHPDVATSLSNLAYVLQNKEQYGDAEVYYRQALAMRRKLLGDEHPHVGHGLLNLAAVLQDQSRFDEAAPYAREALSIYRGIFGEEHVLVAQAINNLAWVLRNQGDLRQAEPLFREVIGIREALYGATHPRLAQAQAYLASLLHELGRTSEAAGYFRAALTTLDPTQYARHPYRALALTGYGEVLITQEQFREADILLADALSIRGAILPEGHWQIAETQCALGYSLLLQERYAEATPLLEEATQTLKRKRGSEHPETRRAEERLAELQARAREGRFARAVRVP